MARQDVAGGVAVSVPDGVAPGQGGAELDPQVWASGVGRGPDGALRVAGVDVRDEPIQGSTGFTTA